MTIDIFELTADTPSSRSHVAITRMDLDFVPQKDFVFINRDNNQAYMVIRVVFKSNEKIAAIVVKYDQPFGEALASLVS